MIKGEWFGLKDTHTLTKGEESSLLELIDKLIRISFLVSRIKEMLKI